MERLYILDPYDNDHVNLLMNYEKENKVSTKSLETLLKVRESLSKEEYQELKKNINDIEMSLILEESGTIKDLCFIQGEKDIKTCKLFFNTIVPKTKTRKLLNLATDFALNTLGMESVFVLTNKEDKVMHTSLENRGYESLGVEGDSIIYLKEQEFELEHNHINNI